MFLRSDVLTRFIYNRKFRKLHPNSSIRIGKLGNRAAYDFLLSDRFQSGTGTYGLLNVHASANNAERLSIGKYCQISGDSHFLLGGEHHTGWFTTYPVRDLILHEGNSSFSKGPIVLDDEVWIGQNALILSGVHIGKGAIVSAGALVVRDVPAYSIVGGSPAHVIKMRFSDAVIQKLLRLTIPYNRIHGNDLHLLEQDLTDENVDAIVSALSEVTSKVP